MKTRKFSWLALTLVAGLWMAIPGEASAQYAYFYQPPMSFSYPRWGTGYGGYGSYGGYGGGYGNYGGGYGNTTGNYGGGYYPGNNLGYFGPARSADYVVTVTPGFGAAGDFYPRMRSDIGPAVGVASTSPLLEVGTLAPRSQAQISVILPSANAQVWFDETAMQQTGFVRTFMTPTLDVNRPYSFQIRAQWTDAQGQVQTSTRSVTFRAGDVIRVNFTS